MEFLPKSRDTALCNFANNKPLNLKTSQAFKIVPDNAVAAWVYIYKSEIVRFHWLPQEALGPRATLLYISNGPQYFSNLWVKLVVREVVARSRLFSALPIILLKKVLLC